MTMPKLSAAGLQKKLDALKPGERICLQNISEDMYHAADGIGSTLLKAATKSLAHYQHAKDDVSSADHFVVGHAAHTMVLEPIKFDQRFVVQPEDIKTRRGKKWDDFYEANADKEILRQSDNEIVNDMANAIFDACGKLFVNGKAEISYWYRHPNGLLLKARVDYKNGDGIIDLKTTRHDTPKKFSNAVKYDYDMQDAHYRLVTGLSDMIYVGVGKTAPYSVFIAKQGQDVRAKAEAKLEGILADIAYAEEYNDFPNLPVEMVVTELTEREKAEAAA